jgi:hypothetical protein
VSVNPAASQADVAAAQPDVEKALSAASMSDAPPLQTGGNGDGNSNSNGNGGIASNLEASPQSVTNSAVGNHQATEKTPGSNSQDSDKYALIASAPPSGSQDYSNNIV